MSGNVITSPRKIVTKPSSINPAINAAQRAVAFGFLRQALTLIVAAVTTSIGSTISSGTETTEIVKTVAANAAPTPVPTTKRPIPRGVSNRFETNTSSGGIDS